MGNQTTVLLAAAMVVAVCPAADCQSAQARSQRPFAYVTRQCNENALHLRLDPGPLQDAVGQGFSLVLEEEKAQVAIVVHDCHQIWINGEDFGPAQELRVWVSIRGLGDVRPVVGAERTAPTQTWFTLFEGTSNRRVRDAKTAVGIAEGTVDSLFLDPGGSQRGGRVYLRGKLAFSWRVPSLTAPSIRLLGLNHDVYRRDSTGSAVLTRIQALMHVSADLSPGTLEVADGVGELSLIGPGTYPVSVRLFFPMWARATLGLSPSR